MYKRKIEGIILVAEHVKRNSRVRFQKVRHEEPSGSEIQYRWT